MHPLHTLLNNQPVQWKTLGEVVKLKNGKDWKRLQSGDVPVYGSGGVMTHVNQAAYNKPTVLIPRKGSITNIFYVDTPFWNVDTIYYTEINTEILSPKYFYYFMKTVDLTAFDMSTARPSLTQAVLNEIPVPLPPLPLQARIVEILDKFTACNEQLTAALNKEHTLRKKQYAYYRDLLLSEAELSKVGFEWKALGEVCQTVCSGGTPTAGRDDFYQNGSIPWLRTQEVKFNEIFDTEVKITPLALEKSSAKWIPENCVIVAISGATAGRVAINKIPLTTNQHCCNLQINPEIALYKYVFYWISREFENIKSLGQGARSDLNSGIIKNYPIPIPPLAHQHKIVDILDRFDTLTNSITQGLPREIELRRKQYEYYRELLLNFE